MLASTQLGLCPEASTHVEQMKDVLLAISNELLDDATDLSPDRVEQLRQERFIAQSILFPFSWLLNLPFFYKNNNLASFRKLWYILANFIGNNTATRD